MRSSLDILSMSKSTKSLNVHLKVLRNKAVNYGMSYVAIFFFDSV